MRPERERKKKLIVAFHFQFANQAAWRCDQCRKNGLEVIRRCGVRPEHKGHARTVWARRRISIESCPVSYVCPESLALIQEFQAWKLIGGGNVYELPARTVDAFCVLENELRAEMKSEHE